MKKFALGLMVGCVLCTAGALAFPITVENAPTVIANVSDDGKVTLTKGWTCEDALRVAVGLEKLDGEWHRKPVQFQSGYLNISPTNQLNLTQDNQMALPR